MEPFARLDELKDRLDWTLDADEERIARGALEDASDLARAFGKPWQDAASAPRMVRTLVLTACTRYMRNPGGYTTSRAGDETLGFTDVGDRAGTIYFTSDERKLLQGLAGNNSRMLTAPVTAWGPMDKKLEGFVPVEGPGKPFPFFSSDEGPW